MGRYIPPPTTKGSQKWLQILINERPDIIDKQIKNNLNLIDSERMEWLSPKSEDDYAEYYDEAFLKKLGAQLKKIHLCMFWPKRGPQWDALGKSSSGKLFLVEAKSHVSELISDSEARSKRSIEQIKRSLRETKDYLGSKSRLDWSTCFYQYTNRLAHLHLLRKNDLQAYLVFLYFVNDKEMKGPNSIGEWKAAIELLHACLGIGRHKLNKFIAEVFVDVNTIP